MLLGGNAEFGQKGGELQQRVDTIDNLHVGDSDLTDKVQLQMLIDVDALADTEYVRNDVLRRVSQLPQLGQDFVGLVYVVSSAMVDHLL